MSYDCRLIIASWSSIGDVQDDSGKYRKHPKVYAGFFKHANFFNKKTNINIMGADQDEFRSNDWFFLPQEKDLVDGRVIPDDWTPAYGQADSPPSKTRKETICRW